MPWRTGSVVPRDEAALGAVEHRPFDAHAADRVRTVEHDELLPCACAAAVEAFAHRGDVGVEAAADVLDVEDQRVEAVELFGGRRAAFAVEAVDRQAGLLVARVADLLVERRRGCRARG